MKCGNNHTEVVVLYFCCLFFKVRCLDLSGVLHVHPRMKSSLLIACMLVIYF